MNIALRVATDDDIPAILALWLAAAENSDRPADTSEAVAAVIRRDSEALILAVDAAEIVGTIIAGWDGWRCHLYRLAVSPDRRREGIGHALLAAAEQRGRSLGAVRVDAMVLDSNELGRSIWNAAGYQRQVDWRRWVKSLTSRHSSP